MSVERLTVIPRRRTPRKSGEATGQSVRLQSLDDQGHRSILLHIVRIGASVHHRYQRLCRLPLSRLSLCSGNVLPILPAPTDARRHRTAPHMVNRGSQIVGRTPCNMSEVRSPWP
jgi:hypothetical protein